MSSLGNIEGLRSRLKVSIYKKRIKKISDAFDFFHENLVFFGTCMKKQKKLKGEGICWENIFFLKK